MIYNKLILYCFRLEQAMLWEACKKRRCRTSNCIYQKIVNHFGENLWSDEPRRFSTITQVKENLEALTKPVPLRRVPILAKSATPATAFTRHPTLPPPSRMPTSLTDILRDQIEREIAKGPSP